MPCNVVVLPNRPSRPVASEDTQRPPDYATRSPHAHGRLGRSAARRGAGNMQLHGVAVGASDAARLTAPNMGCDRPLPRSEGIDEDRLHAVLVLLSHDDMIRSKADGAP